jgi:hypothetical protein
MKILTIILILFSISLAVAVPLVARDISIDIDDDKLSSLPSELTYKKVCSDTFCDVDIYDGSMKLSAVGFEITKDMTEEEKNSIEQQMIKEELERIADYKASIESDKSEGRINLR